MIYLLSSSFIFFFFFNDTATTEIYTLSLHDALPIRRPRDRRARRPPPKGPDEFARSEEHTSELQSRENLVCRLLLEKKKKQRYIFSQIGLIEATKHAYYVITTA